MTKAFGLLRVVKVEDDKVIVITQNQASPNARGARNELNGELDSIGWDVSSTYHSIAYRQINNDYLIARMELGLRGFGSLGGAPNCTARKPRSLSISRSKPR